jgi:hypothetical protein
MPKDFLLVFPSLDRRLMMIKKRETMNDREQINPNPWIPLVIPSGWIKGRGWMDSISFDSSSLRVLVSAAIERDGNKWLHLSISRRDRCMPRWEDLQLMRTIFSPKDAHGYMCFPPESEYVHQPVEDMPSIRVEVLHVFYCLDARPLPDFRPDPNMKSL